MKQFNKYSFVWSSSECLLDQEPEIFGFAVILSIAVKIFIIGLSY